jgi:hypothetical protein
MDAAQQIVDTGEVPAAWRRKGPVQKRHIKKLQSLIRSVEHNSIIKQDQKDQLLLELKAAEEDWRKQL